MRRGKNPRRWENVAQGSLSSLAAFPLRRGFDGAASRYLHPLTCPQFLRTRPMIIRITLLATQQEPASLEEPQGRTAGPALPVSSPLSPAGERRPRSGSSGVRGNADLASGCTNLFEEELKSL